jgi:hypothetical protein
MPSDEAYAGIVCTRRLLSARSAGAVLLTVALFIGGLLVGVGCGVKPGVHPVTLTYTQSGKTYTTVTGP